MKTNKIKKSKDSKELSKKEEGKLSCDAIYKNWLKTASNFDKEMLKITSKCHKLTLREAYFATYWEPEEDITK